MNEYEIIYNRKLKDQDVRQYGYVLAKTVEEANEQALFYFGDNIEILQIIDLERIVAEYEIS